ncbi:hypothetical protein P154DRAFT_577960 [Amniculicola lignicola CBS 123094]|uniref:MYND-type zinc finger protein samB n=1 Tax=Amniculicola lignicola CBS 123094 TaxID=1392246 RepID=A0A6A5WC43_9PLEO|nr:hypothetical protein P154DRAFT_577960 [Amniculicola lignicola CBS 123094]
MSYSSPPDPQRPAPSPCANCGDSGTLICQSCELNSASCVYENGKPAKAVDLTWYCSTECREAHKEDHADECGQWNRRAEARNVLEAADCAGQIAQEIFYVFTEATWSHDMSEAVVEKDENGNVKSVALIDGKGTSGPKSGPSSLKRQGGHWFYQFNAATTGSASTSHALQATLADGNSIWAFVFMHAAIKYLFQDLVDNTETDIKEVTHLLHPRWKCIVNYQNTAGEETFRSDQLYPEHNGIGVYHITLRGGQIIALDLANAQYNYHPHQTVTEWDTYWSRFGYQLVSIHPLKMHYNMHHKVIRPNEDATDDLFWYEGTLNLSVILTRITLEWTHVICKMRTYLSTMHLEPSNDESKKTALQGFRELKKMLFKTIQDSKDLLEIPSAFFPQTRGHPAFWANKDNALGEVEQLKQYITVQAAAKARAEVNASEKIMKLMKEQAFGKDANEKLIRRLEQIGVLPPSHEDEAGKGEGEGEASGVGRQKNPTAEKGKDKKALTTEQAAKKAAKRKAQRKKKKAEKNAGQDTAADEGSGEEHGDGNEHDDGVEQKPSSSRTEIPKPMSEKARGKQKVV